MCLVLFAWLTDQTYFKELTNMDIRKKLWDEKQNLVDQDMAPFGFVLNGVRDEHGVKIGETIDEYDLLAYEDVKKMNMCLVPSQSDFFNNSL